MLIDIFAHILPEEYFARREQIIPGAGVPSARAIPCLFDLGVRFRIMDQFDRYQQILSLASPPLVLGPVKVTADLTRLGNDGLAGLVRAHPDRFVGALGTICSKAYGADQVFRRLAHPPERYFTRFYADTALNGGVHALRCALEYFPSERVLFGTDTPFEAEGSSRNIRRPSRRWMLAGFRQRGGR